MIKNKKKWEKGEMSKTIVIFCIRVLTFVLLWAIALTTISVIFALSIDLSAVLTFAATAFGGELLLLAFKRVFSKSESNGG